VLKSVKVLCLWAPSTNLRDRNPEIRVASRTFGGLNKPTGVRNSSTKSTECWPINDDYKWTDKWQAWVYTANVMIFGRRTISLPVQICRPIFVELSLSVMNSVTFLRSSLVCPTDTVVVVIGLDVENEKWCLQYILTAGLFLGIWNWGGGYKPMFGRCKHVWSANLHIKT